MIRYTIVLFLGILQTVACQQSHRARGLEVTYIGNEGFMISMGGTKVLIDALHKSEHYAHPSDALAVKIMDGIPPFDSIDYALVTHNHADHFDAEMMSRFLRNHPGTHFIGSPATCGELVGDSPAGQQRSIVELKMGHSRTIHGDKAEIMAMRLDHSGHDISNLAFLVRSNGYTMMHVGDALLAHNEEYLKSINWSAYDVDLLFVEYFDLGSPTPEIIQNMIKPKHIVLMHIAAGEEDSVRNVGLKIRPRPVVFTMENETKRFD